MRKAMVDVMTGRDKVYQLGDTIITVGVEDRIIHLYSADSSPSNLLRFVRWFSQAVWLDGYPDLWAPIINPKVAILARHFKFTDSGYKWQEFKFYRVERKNYE
ncbi:MAG: hypothetical protein ACREQ5_05095 [Candidatus Dormibacteria bacterium]